MAFQFSTAARNAAIDAIEAAIGTSPILRIRTGAPPANCAAARTGTVLATMALPSDFSGAASNGSKALSGTWQDASADATGTAGHFEIMDNSGTVCHLQGTVSQRASDGGTGDLQLEQETAGLVAGQTVSVSALTITAGGA